MQIGFGQISPPASSTRDLGRRLYLESSNTMDTHSFINALRRFIRCRGPIRQLRSDQGTNFVGAKGELKEALRELDHDTIRSELLKENCDWFVFKMNVPSASHFGGVWERQIWSVRSVTHVKLTWPQQLSSKTWWPQAEPLITTRVCHSWDHWPALFHV